MMNRSGYTDEVDDPLAIGRWRAQVNSAIRGKRGQAFLRELAVAMDAMLEKILIRGDLIDQAGDCCAIGVVCKARELDVRLVDVDDPEEVGSLVGIARQMAAEIEYENDEGGPWSGESDANRWLRMRRWVAEKLGESILEEWQ